MEDKPKFRLTEDYRSIVGDTMGFDLRQQADRIYRDIRKTAMATIGKEAEDLTPYERFCIASSAGCPVDYGLDGTTTTRYPVSIAKGDEPDGPYWLVGINRGQHEGAAL